MNETRLPGICGICGLAKPCRVSNLGSVCSDCIQANLTNEPDEGRARIGVPPPEDLDLWFIVERHGDDLVYIAVHGTIHGFHRAEDAQWTVAKLGEAGQDCRSMRIDRMPAFAAFLYAWNAGLRMVTVIERKEGARP